MSHNHHRHGHHSPPPSPHAGGTHTDAPATTRPSSVQTKTYGFVKCRVAGNIHMKGTQLRAEVQYHLHADLTVAGFDQKWDTAINVGTSDSDDLLNYRLVPDFHHALIGPLKESAPGFHDLTGQTAFPALDFLRTDILAETGDWRPSDPIDGSLNAKPVSALKPLLERAAAEHADVYIFGRRYLTGGDGIHDIHMNQGSRAPHLHVSKDGNDVWQDGAVLFDFGTPQWIGYFTAFTQQLAPTDGVGDPVAGSHPVGNADVGSLKAS